MKPNRYLLVSEYYYPVDTSTGYYMSEIANYLYDKKINIKVITTNTHYRNNHKHFAIVDKVPVLRIPISKNKSKRKILNILASIKISILLSISVKKTIKKDDSLILVTNPPFLLLFIRLFIRIKKQNTVLIIHDFFPFNLISTKFLKRESILYKLLCNFYISIYRSVKKTIVLGRDMAEFHKKVIGTDSVFIVPNWADTDKVYPISKQNTSLFQTLKQKSKLIIQFAGNIGLAQDIDSILLLAKACINLDILFLFIGDGKESGKVKAFSGSNILYIPFIDKSEQNNFLNCADIGLVSLREGMEGLGVPSRAYNILAAGKPILYIGNPNGEIARLVIEDKCGWSFTYNQIEKIKEFLIWLLDNMDSLSFYCNQARKIAEQKYNIHKMLENYYNVLRT